MAILQKSYLLFLLPCLLFGADYAKRFGIGFGVGSESTIGFKYHVNRVYAIEPRIGFNLSTSYVTVMEQGYYGYSSSRAGRMTDRQLAFILNQQWYLSTKKLVDPFLYLDFGLIILNDASAQFGTGLGVQYSFNETVSIFGKTGLTSHVPTYEDSFFAFVDGSLGVVFYLNRKPDKGRELFKQAREERARKRRFILAPSITLVLPGTDNYDFVKPFIATGIKLGFLVNEKVYHGISLHLNIPGSIFYTSPEEVEVTHKYGYVGGFYSYKRNFAIGDYFRTGLGISAGVRSVRAKGTIDIDRSNSDTLRYTNYYSNRFDFGGPTLNFSLGGEKIRFSANALFAMGIISSGKETEYWDLNTYDSNSFSMSLGYFDDVEDTFGITPEFSIACQILF